MTEMTEALTRSGQLAGRFGITVRTLHHYDEIGLLTPSERSGAGYRLYTEAGHHPAAAHRASTAGSGSPWRRSRCCWRTRRASSSTCAGSAPRCVNRLDEMRDLVDGHRPSTGEGVQRNEADQTGAAGAVR